MSTTDVPAPVGSPSAALVEPTPITKRAWFPFALAGLVFLAMVIISRYFGAKALLSSGTFGAMLILGTPILLAGLGGLYAERSGIVNIGLEGMMIMGTWFGAWAGIEFGPWVGLGAGIIAGAMFGGLHALATVGFGVNHVVSGVAINLLAPGIARFLSSKVFVDQGGSVSTSPTIRGESPDFTLPFLSGGEVFGWKSPDLFGWVAKQNWFFVSELAGALKGLTTDVPWMVAIALALVPFTAWLLWRTTFGLRLRSAGENPWAADSLGVSVYKMQSLACVISGALAGFGGALLVLESTRNYKEGQVAGRGFIGMAALIFGNWRPFGVAAGAGLFGFADGLALRDLTGKSVRGLLLLFAIAVAILAVTGVLRKRMVQGAVAGIAAVLLLIWFASTEQVPNTLVSITAPVVTLVVLVVAGRQLRPPKYDGYIWRKGVEE